MKVRVFALQSAHSVVSLNFADIIEEKVNNNPTFIDDVGKTLHLEDYQINKIEGKSYLILKYKKV